MATQKYLPRRKGSTFFTIPLAVGQTEERPNGDEITLTGIRQQVYAGYTSTKAVYIVAPRNLRKTEAGKPKDKTGVAYTGLVRVRAV